MGSRPNRKLNRRTFLGGSAALAVTSSFAKAYGSSDEKGDRPALKAWRDKGVLDLTDTAHARLHMVPVHAVTLHGGYWSSRLQINVRSSIPTMHEELLMHGRMTNFYRLSGKSTAPHSGLVYDDSDMYKWLEAVAFAAQGLVDPAVIDQAMNDLKDILAVQEPSGYLNTYYVQAKASQRMTPSVQEGGHELYCLGHFLQAGIAWYRANGDRRMLDAGIRFVDDFLLPQYGPEPKQPIVAGHPEIEMALVELYRTTGKRSYLDLAGYILHGDSRMHLRPGSIRYMFCGVPFASEPDLHGHAVRAMYACCGATDYFLETGDPAYRAALDRLWEDLSQRQMYVTGGVGARSQGEAFGDPYELPNAQAYGESCAAIGNMMWNARLLAGSGDAKYADVMERALYNAINSGMSLDGTTYCYRNPLAFDPKTGGQIRNPWYETTCCPPNLERTLASLPGYFYSTSHDGLYVHLYDNSTLEGRLEDGTALRVEQHTQYPWHGEIALQVTPAKETAFTLYLRIPAWSATTRVEVNGVPASGIQAGTYLAVRRTWAKGDRVQISFDMTPRMIQANPAVEEDVGKLVFQRGPLVYCMEGLDQAAPGSSLSLAGYRLSPSGKTIVEYKADLLGGIVVLKHEGQLQRSTQKTPLYRALDAGGNEERDAATISLIPYYAWANRTPSPMQVWIKTTDA